MGHQLKWDAVRRKARKEHRSDCSGGAIPAGSEYVEIRYIKGDGRFPDTVKWTIQEYEQFMRGLPAKRKS